MNHNILVVDDEDVNVFLYKRILREHKLTIAKSRQEMMNVLDNTLPDIILLDIMLPDGDGFEIAKELTHIPNFSDIPVIFVTAKAQSDDIIEGLDLGAYDYITKPFDAKILHARIKKTIEIKRKEQELFKLATTDTLTQLYNKRYFNLRGDEILNHSKRTCTNFSVAILDIDFFKDINDTYGHMCGDEVLEKFSKILSDEVRPYDIVARFGGEEFTILFVDCDRNESQNVLERIKNKVKEGVFLSCCKVLQFTFSAGISEFDEFNSNEVNSITSLMQIADQRLYTAKNSGRDMIIIK